MAIFAQSGAAGGVLGPQFAWEIQTPWGAARSNEIAEFRKLMTAPIDRAAVRAEPFQIFDNVYYVGIKTVSSFLITTNAGLVLLDTTVPETADLVLENVRKVGFDPANIKYILISHSHPDHFGGAGQIKELTGAHIVMSSRDWHSVENQQEAARKGGRSVGVPFAIDIVKEEGDTLKVGDSVFKFYLTPGHTIGALSAEFQVFDRGHSYRALSPGGLGMQFSPEWTESFTKSMEHLKALGPWDVILTDHPFMMLRNLDDLRRELIMRGDRPNPAVSGPVEINQWFDAILKIAHAKRAAEQEQTKQ
jgi:metallo-beta-lactamase class B